MRSGPGEAKTILLLHIISVRPSKQPLMVRTFLKVYMELGSYFLFLQEIKDIIIIGRDQWGGKRIAGGMSEDNDRCFSTMVLGVFSTGVFQHHYINPALTLAQTCGANRTS